jgi:hypothetical protein
MDFQCMSKTYVRNGATTNDKTTHAVPVRAVL